MNQNKPVPATPRPGYKHSSLGWIPEEWEVVRVNEVATLINGRGFKPHEWKEEGLPIIRIQNLNGSTEYNYYLGDFNPKILVEYGQLLFAWSGSKGTSFGPHVWKGKPGLLNYHTWKVNIERRNIHDEFFLHILTYLTTKIEEKAHGASALVHTQKGEMEKFPIPLPPLPEQRAIARILSTWDQGIEALRKLIAARQQRKKGLMQQLLTGKKRVKGFGGEWREYHYGDILKQVKRPVNWNDEELYELISVRRRSGGLFHRESLYGHQILTKDLRTAKKGDFLISKMQVLHGASGLTTYEFDGMKISGSYIAVVARNPATLDIKFFDWLSKMPYFYHQTYIASYGVHIEKMTFDFKSFLKLETYLPPLEEQRAIAAILQAADREIALLEQKLAAMQQQKKGLMQALLTGVVRVKGGSNPP